MAVLSTPTKARVRNQSSFPFRLFISPILYKPLIHQAQCVVLIRRVALSFYSSKRHSIITNSLVFYSIVLARKWRTIKASMEQFPRQTSMATQSNTQPPLVPTERLAMEPRLELHHRLAPTSARPIRSRNMEFLTSFTALEVHLALAP